ncbi:MAG: F0F1 ATP synthase subunit alpha [Mycoplasmoidaceae bacterium]
MISSIEKFSYIIKEQIKKYSSHISDTEVGIVISVGDGIVEVSGLRNVMLNELLLFNNGSLGIALNLEVNSVGVIVLGEYVDIKEGTIVKRTGKITEVPVGDQLLGRVINPLGQAVDGRDEIKCEKFYPIERIASGVMTRESVKQPLETGILAIDAMFPIGKGQRELIIGDRQTGKTSIAIDAIINQKGKNVKCVYVAIGQKNSTIALIKKSLQKHNAMDYTTIVLTSASDSPAFKYIAPFSGTAIAEYWMEKGQDVLIIYDDLSKHAVAYRTLSLLLRRPPGREAYPGDVFYLHSRLLERSVKLSKKYGGGSITSLPIIETQSGDISAYIPTNVISITDGQLFLVSKLFNSGQRPAIDAGLSVSRVGGDAQIKSVKEMGASLKLDLAQFRELEAFSQFGSDLDNETINILNHGRKVLEIIKQQNMISYDQTVEAALLFIIKYKYIQYIPDEYIKEFKEDFIIDFSKIELHKQLSKMQAFTPETKKILADYVSNFIQLFVIKIIDYDWSKFPPIEDIKNAIIR